MPKTQLGFTVIHLEKGRHSLCVVPVRKHHFTWHQSIIIWSSKPLRSLRSMDSGPIMSLFYILFKLYAFKVNYTDSKACLTQCMLHLWMNRYAEEKGTRAFSKTNTDAGSSTQCNADKNVSTCTPTDRSWTKDEQIRGWISLFLSYTRLVCSIFSVSFCVVLKCYLLVMILKGQVWLTMQHLLTDCSCFIQTPGIPWWCLQFTIEGSQILTGCMHLH